MWRCKDCGKVFDKPDAHECCGTFQEDTRFELIEEQKIHKQQCIIPWQLGTKAPCGGIYVTCHIKSIFPHMNIADTDGHFACDSSDIYAYVNLEDLPMPKL